MVNAKDPYLYSNATNAHDVILRYAGQTSFNTFNNTFMDHVTELDSYNRLDKRFRIVSISTANVDSYSRIIQRLRSLIDHSFNVDTFIRTCIRVRSYINNVANLDSLLQRTNKFRSFINNLFNVDSKSISLIQYISGITQNSGGTPIGNCVVLLYRADTNAYVTSGVSDANGKFAFVVTKGIAYFVVAYKLDSPDIQGVTDRDLERD